MPLRGEAGALNTLTKTSLGSQHCSQSGVLRLNKHRLGPTLFLSSLSHLALHCPCFREHGCWLWPSSSEFILFKPNLKELHLKGAGSPQDMKHAQDLLPDFQEGQRQIFVWPSLRVWVYPHGADPRGVRDLAEAVGCSMEGGH